MSTLHRALAERLAVCAWLALVPPLSVGATELMPAGMLEVPIDMSCDAPPTAGECPLAPAEGDTPRPCESSPGGADSLRCCLCLQAGGSSMLAQPAPSLPNLPQQAMCLIPAPIPARSRAPQPTVPPPQSA